jgi:Aldehyde dehydrogenase family
MRGRLRVRTLHRARFPTVLSSLCVSAGRQDWLHGGVPIAARSPRRPPPASRVTLELGGKTAAILLDDVALPQAMRGLAPFTMPFSGQICFARWVFARTCARVRPGSMSPCPASHRQTAAPATARPRGLPPHARSACPCAAVTRRCACFGRLGRSPQRRSRNSDLLFENRPSLLFTTVASMISPAFRGSSARKCRTPKNPCHRSPSQQLVKA